MSLKKLRLRPCPLTPCTGCSFECGYTISAVGSQRLGHGCWDLNPAQACSVWRMQAVSFFLLPFFFFLSFILAAWIQNLRYGGYPGDSGDASSFQERKKEKKKKRGGGGGNIIYVYMCVSIVCMHVVVVVVIRHSQYICMCRVVESRSRLFDVWNGINPDR